MLVVTLLITIAITPLLFHFYSPPQFGVALIDNWLSHIRDVRQKHEAILSRITDESDRADRLCELNVVEQVRNVCHTTVVEACERAFTKDSELQRHSTSLPAAFPANCRTASRTLFPLLQQLSALRSEIHEATSGRPDIQ